MSKVVHLSERAHHRAKLFCKRHDLKMSEWVAALIEAASGDYEASPGPVAAVAEVAAAADGATAPTTGAQRVVKKRLAQHDAVTTAPAANHNGEDAEMEAYALPPFWARRAQMAESRADGQASSLG